MADLNVDLGRPERSQVYFTTVYLRSRHGVIEQVWNLVVVLDWTRQLGSH